MCPDIDTSLILKEFQPPDWLGFKGLIVIFASVWLHRVLNNFDLALTALRQTSLKLQRCARGSGRRRLQCIGIPTMTCPGRGTVTYQGFT